MTTTWDGLEAAAEAPFGAQVVVYRHALHGLEILMLHRAHHGPDYDGDWAWTHPSGCRFPEETIADCAERELQEEAGVRLLLELTDCGSEDWPLYLAEMDNTKKINLIDPEHDRYEWMADTQALAHCRPAIIHDPLERAITLIKSRRH